MQRAGRAPSAGQSRVRRPRLEVMGRSAMAESIDRAGQATSLMSVRVGSGRREFGDATHRARATIAERARASRGRSSRPIRVARLRHAPLVLGQEWLGLEACLAVGHGRHRQSKDELRVGPGKVRFTALSGGMVREVRVFPKDRPES